MEGDFAVFCLEKFYRASVSRCNCDNFLHHRQSLGFRLLDVKSKKVLHIGVKKKTSVLCRKAVSDKAKQ